ncbi:MAG: hypothetical protein K2X27_01510 [Candidatus Obscuribacterales bacterium]|nr:hypothetical protein [Candidatus Obscuribacterales bacterium]
MIAYKLKMYGQSGIYTDPECECPYHIEFRLENKAVIVNAIDTRSGKPLKSAWVPLDEFVDAADEYFRRVVRYCSEICPEINESDEIQHWLTAYDEPDGPYHPY